MKFVKKEEEETREYIFQKNKKTLFGANFIIAVLVLLIIAVLISIIYFEF